MIVESQGQQMTNLFERIPNALAVSAGEITITTPRKFENFSVRFSTYTAILVILSYGSHMRSQQEGFP